MSASGHLISSPWLAMVLGLMAGLVSIGGAKCLPVSCWATNTCSFGLDWQAPGTMAGHCVVPCWLLRLASKPLRLDGAFVRMWGASRRTRSSLLRHKGESVQGCWGVTEPADRDVAGSPRTAGTRDGSVVGAQEVPALLSLLFPNICFILICRPPSSSPNPTSTPHGRM